MARPSRSASRPARRPARRQRRESRRRLCAAARGRRTTLRAHHVILATGIAPYRHVPEALQGLAERLSHSADRSRLFALSPAPRSSSSAPARRRPTSQPSPAATRRRGHAGLSRRQLTFYPGGAARGWFDQARRANDAGRAGLEEMDCRQRSASLFRKLPQAAARRDRQARRWGRRRAGSSGKPSTARLRCSPARRSSGAHETPRGVGAGNRRGRRRPRHRSWPTMSSPRPASGSTSRGSAILDPACLRGSPRWRRRRSSSAHFESSVPGLYFVGTTAAYEFGADAAFRRAARNSPPERVAASVARASRTAPRPRSAQTAPLARLGASRREPTVLDGARPARGPSRRTRGRQSVACVTAVVVFLRFGPARSRPAAPSLSRPDQ